jgi:hypothetical protein
VSHFQKLISERQSEVNMSTNGKKNVDASVGFLRQHAAMDVLEASADGTIDIDTLIGTYEELIMVQMDRIRIGAQNERTIHNTIESVTENIRLASKLVLTLLSFGESEVALSAEKALAAMCEDRPQE